MADITSGTGSTINATKAEGALFQSIHFIQNAERGSTETERFESKKDDTFRMKGRFTLPGKINFNATTGLFTVTAEPYLPSGAFNAGNPLGTIKGTTFSQYFVDLCSYIILWQQNTAKNLNSQYNVSLTFNYSTLEFAGEFDIPYTVSLSTGGSIIESATEWLLT